MNNDLLKKHIDNFVSNVKKQPEKYTEDFKERLDLISYYQAFTKEKILSMSEDEIYEYISKLWAMLIWGNKHYVVDKIIDENGIDNFRTRLADFVWSKKDITNRWNDFRKNIKGMGPAMMSEILCKTHPNDFIVWNRRAYVGLNYLGVNKLPRYDYQLTGKVYSYLCETCKKIANDIKESGLEDTTLLAVDYFIWDELQVEVNLSKIYSKTNP